MINKFNIAEWAERYLNHTLSSAEKVQLEKALENDVILQKEWQETIEVLQILNDAQLHQEVKAHLADIKEVAAPNKVVKFVTKYWKTASIAAAIGVVSSIFTASILNKDQSHQSVQFTQLKREIANIKHNQSALIQSFDSSNKNEKETTAENYTGGTGFALNTNGYIATNYHVVKDAENIKVQLSNLNELEAHLVAFDSNSDVAIIKINDKDFKFDGKIPYNLQQNSSMLGSKIFTLGYPQDNLTYNEGYISSMKGFKNDSLSYQLEITSNPGQSGSPVIDKKGNVIGIIVGKKTDSYGTTYAKHTSSIIELIKSLPAEHAIKINNNQPIQYKENTDQVSKYQNYIVSIKAK